MQLHNKCFETGNLVICNYYQNRNEDDLDLYDILLPQKYFPCKHTSMVSLENTKILEGKNGRIKRWCHLSFFIIKNARDAEIYLKLWLYSIRFWDCKRNGLHLPFLIWFWFFDFSTNPYFIFFSVLISRVKRVGLFPF